MSGGRGSEMTATMRWFMPLGLASIVSSAGCAQKPDVISRAVLSPVASHGSSDTVDATIGRQDTLHRAFGTLIHRPMPVKPRKSVRAYLGREFVLNPVTLSPPPNASKETLIDGLKLTPSRAVTREQLRTFAGQEVSLDCRYTAATAPDPREQHPINADGSPLLRPRRRQAAASE